MWSVDIETPLIKVKEKYKPPFVIFLGILTTTWASCCFVVSLAQFGDHNITGVSKNVIVTSILSFWTISVSVSYGLYYAFKEQDQFYIVPWITVKIIEVTLIIISIILLAVYGWYAWLIFPAVIFLLIGSYLIFCMLKTYRKANNIWQATIPTNIERDKGSWPLVEIPLLPLNDKLKAPFLITGGLLISLWANCISSAGMSENTIFFILYNLSAGFGVATYIMISLGSTWCIIYGINQNDPGFVRLWLLNKILDQCEIILGIILIIVDHGRAWPLIIVGVIIGAIGFYMIRIVWKLHNVMKLVHFQPNPPNANNNTENNTTENNTTETIRAQPTIHVDEPPTYEQFVNQANRF